MRLDFYFILVHFISFHFILLYFILFYFNSQIVNCLALTGLA